MFIASGCNLWKNDRLKVLFNQLNGMSKQQIDIITNPDKRVINLLDNNTSAWIKFIRHFLLTKRKWQKETLTKSNVLA